MRNYFHRTIDRFFSFNENLTDKLVYRTINFVREDVDQEYFQENPVVKYRNKEVDLA